MRILLASVAVAALAVAVAADVTAQGRGGRGGVGGFGGGGMQRGALLRLESVQEELGLEDVQIDDIRTLQREMRGERGDRANFRDMTPEERRAAAADRQKQQNEKLAEILDSDQMNRLNEIYLQVAGGSALMDPMIAEKLDITADQQQAIQDAVRDEMAKMREAFQSGDRDAMRQRMEEIRSNIEKAAVATLTDAQRDQLDEMKGEPFELSDEDRQALRAGRGGPGGPAGPGGGGRRRGRPQADE